MYLSCFCYVFVWLSVCVFLCQVVYLVCLLVCLLICLLACCLAFLRAYKVVFLPQGVLLNLFCRSLFVSLCCFGLCVRVVSALVHVCFVLCC